MLSRQKLFWLSRAYDLPGSDARFLRAVRDNCAYHIKHCPEYRLICQAEGFSPDCLNTIGDLEKIPVLPTLFFNAEKWRSSLGAYSFYDCFAGWGQVSTWNGYQIGSEMIS